MSWLASGRANGRAAARGRTYARRPDDGALPARQQQVPRIAQPKGAGHVALPLLALLQLIEEAEVPRHHDGIGRACHISQLRGAEEGRRGGQRKVGRRRWRSGRDIPLVQFNAKKEKLKKEVYSRPSSLAAWQIAPNVEHVGNIFGGAAGRVHGAEAAACPSDCVPLRDD